LTGQGKCYPWGQRTRKEIKKILTDGKGKMEFLASSANFANCNLKGARKGSRQKKCSPNHVL